MQLHGTGCTCGLELQQHVDLETTLAVTPAGEVRSSCAGPGITQDWLLATKEATTPPTAKGRYVH